MPRNKRSRRTRITDDSEDEDDTVTPSSRRAGGEITPGTARRSPRLAIEAPKTCASEWCRKTVSTGSTFCEDHDEETPRKKHSETPRRRTRESALQKDDDESPRKHLKRNRQARQAYEAESDAGNSTTPRTPMSTNLRRSARLASDAPKTCESEWCRKTAESGRKFCADHEDEEVAETPRVIRRRQARCRYSVAKFGYSRRCNDIPLYTVEFFFNGQCFLNRGSGISVHKKRQ